MSEQFTFLVSKILADEASEKEKEVFRQLLSENSNRVIYMQLKEYWDSEVHVLCPFDKEVLKESILAKLDNLGSNNDIENRSVERSRFKKMFLRAASVAAVFFVTACTFAYLFFAHPKQFYTYEAHTAPTEYVLPDGTTVMLNKNSQLTFDSKFGKKKRDVKLKGEAFFKVITDKQKPFLVEASGTQTKVLGTSFNVKTAEKSITTTLIEGSVLFFADNCNVRLKPGEEVVYDLLSGEYEKQRTDTQLNTAWATGNRFDYFNITFSALTRKLEQIYGYKIVIDNNKVASRVISASFSMEQPIEEIMKALENELFFNYIIDTDKKQIIITCRTL